MSIKHFLGKQVRISVFGGGSVSIQTGILKKEGACWVIREPGTYLSIADTKTFVFDEIYYGETGVACFAVSE